jgi:hypothetical protein
MILGSLHITKSTLVTFFAIVLAMFSAVACETAEPTPLPNPTNVDLRAILDLRESNEVAADAQYIGMYVRMEGIVSEIHEKDISIIPFGSDSFQMSGAKCKLDENQLAKLVTLRKDEAVTVDGLIKKIDDFMITTIELKPCTIR